MMQNSTQSAPVSLPTPGDTALPTRNREDLAYQAVTVAAILLLLCSLWVF
jgi:hypothetical protein